MQVPSLSTFKLQSWP